MAGEEAVTGGGEDKGAGKPEERMQRGLPLRNEWWDAIHALREDGKVLRLRLGNSKGKTDVPPRLRSG